MNFIQYQKEAHKTSISPKIYCNNTPKLDRDISWVYAALGLSGEVGELHNKISKIIRDDVKIDREDLESELGDILWFLSEVATRFKLDLDKIADKNIQKLKKRQKEGKISGSGDKR